MSGKLHHGKLGFVMSLPAMSLGDRFCMRRKKEWNRGRWVGVLEGCRQHGNVWAWY